MNVMAYQISRFFQLRPGMLLMSVLAITACSNGDDVPVSQLAAQVNGSEITVHQLNTAMQSMSYPPGSDAKTVQKQVLDHLVEQRLLIDKAIEEKLDRDPQVMMAMENARNEVLARSWLERAAGAQVKPGKEDAQEYYKQHPELFADRHVFQLQKLSFPASSDLLAALKVQINSGKNMDEISTWVKSQQLPVNAEIGALAAENIPMQWLPEIAALKEGDSIVFDTPQQIFLVSLMGKKLLPIDEVTALPQIAAILVAQKNKDVARSILENLKKNAKVEYKIDSVAPSGIKAPEASAASVNAKAIEKGVAGL
ncbi:EpsD family peptidyl-prolyl cis-trans isomerase [Craterilacuibacter sp.]|uniref:EpsD family peptidyl-prolyl cis-trans isomerase n=1 Tax=Craterilacuibacter sp. TaxID=2870909 RepID=UPI003F343073